MLNTSFQRRYLYFMWSRTSSSTQYSDSNSVQYCPKFCHPYIQTDNLHSRQNYSLVVTTSTKNMKKTFFPIYRSSIYIYIYKFSIVHMWSYQWKIQSVLLLHTYIKDQCCITANQSYSSKTMKMPKGSQMTLAKKYSSHGSSHYSISLLI